MLKVKNAATKKDYKSIDMTDCTPAPEEDDDEEGSVPIYLSTHVRPADDGYVQIGSVKILESDVLRVVEVCKCKFEGEANLVDEYADFTDVPTHMFDDVEPEGTLTVYIKGGRKLSHDWDTGDTKITLVSPSSDDGVAIVS